MKLSIFRKLSMKRGSLPRRPALWRSLMILGVWTWCLEQSVSSAERHRCCLHLQAYVKSELFFQAYSVSTIASTVADPWDCLYCWLMFFSLTICMLSSFLTCFSVIRSVCWHLHIYIVKRRRPCFVGGAIEIPLIDWLISIGPPSRSSPNPPGRWQMGCNRKVKFSVLNSFVVNGRNSIMSLSLRTQLHKMHRGG